MTDPGRQTSDWWRTEIIDMQPGVIRYRGYAIEELIGNVNFTQMIWLMTRGELPGPDQAELLDTALMSAVDHGPQARSIAAARMAITCGVGINNAMASGVNMLGEKKIKVGNMLPAVFIPLIYYMGLQIFIK